MSFSAGVKGYRYKHGENGNQHHTRNYFYDDDYEYDARPRTSYHNHDDDDDAGRYTTNARKKTHYVKKYKKHKSRYYYDDDEYEGDDMESTYGLTFDDDDCELVTVEDAFTFPSATFFLAPDTTDTTEGTPTLPGTVYLWDDEVVESQTAGNSTTVSGVCTRTSSSLGGICNLVFSDAIEDIQITVNGFLSSPNGGALAITGGTGDLLSNIGQMDFTPTYGNTTVADEDVFLDSLEFQVNMELGIIICPDST